jgi:hypothetical protein
MKSVKATVGGAMEEEASRQFIYAWHRAERGETFHERHHAFESWDTLSRVLTGSANCEFIVLPVCRCMKSHCL